MLNDLLQQFIATIPKLVGAIAILIIGLIIAKMVSKLVLKIMDAIKIDKVADKLHEIEIVDKSNVRIVPSKILSKLTYYVLLFVFLIASADFLGMEVVSELISSIISYLPKVLSAAIVLAIGIFIADLIKQAVRTACKSINMPAGDIISSIVFYFILINVLMMAMNQAEINTEFLKANLSLILGGIIFAFALGYGIASKDMMANILGGLYSKNKFEIGNEIKISGVKGTIIEKDSSSITVQTENSKVIVPMGVLTKESVEKFDK